MNNQKEHVTTEPNQMREVSAAIINLLQDREWEPSEMIQKLSEKFDVWHVREAIWELTAKAAAELTWDRKLKLGKHSGVAA